MTLRELVDTARASGDLVPLVAAIPYARFLGLVVDRQGEELVFRLPYADHLVGNSMLPALHGGTLGALLESTAIFRLLLDTDADQVPKTINLTVEYLRSAGARDTFARAEITRHGRRVANVRAVAWQDDPARPVAAAHAHFLLTR
jgi:uncharacterized protein (TIGR00369 family)